jgi:hypothetical protein
MCDEHTSRSQQAARNRQPDESKAYPDPPMLENHDRRDHVEPDTDARRDLADELEEAGVWPTGGVE